MKKAIFIFLLFSCFPHCVITISIGTPLTSSATKVLFLGAGELGKEVIISLQRLGVEVIAVDRYANAPGMQVAHRAYVISMIDRKALRKVIEQEQPDYIVPEIEAIAIDELCALEQEGFTVIPTAKATYITMNRERIRRLAAEELDIKTSRYRFATSEPEIHKAVDEFGLPIVIKPLMSSSGKGQTIIRKKDEVKQAWQYAQDACRGKKENRVIVEEFVPFDYEITLLTIRHKKPDGHVQTSFCQPIGHLQVKGDYRESWQPHPMKPEVLQKAQRMAKKVTDALGGLGTFGVELFIKGDEVYFSEVSPRPHDTVMVTLISQNLSEFDLHARALLGLPISCIRQYGPAASCALVIEGNSNQVQYKNIAHALMKPDTDLRLFGKPEVQGERRMGVGLACGDTIAQARDKARNVVNSIEVVLS